jgi:hypothetical protein
MGPIYNCANNSHFNILALKCLSLVESSRLMIMTPRHITKLGFGFGIMPYQRTPWKISYFFPFVSFSIV